MQSTVKGFPLKQNYETTIESKDGSVKWYFPRVEFVEITRDNDSIELALRAYAGETQLSVYNGPPVEVEAYITNLEQLDTLDVSDAVIRKTDKGWVVTWKTKNPN